MPKRISFEAHMRILHKGREPAEDLIRISVRTINPDQTGLMTNSEIRRADLPVFWLGVNAVARTWQPNGLPRPDIRE
jgi:hypothetical protein